MRLVFIAKDPNTNGENCPTVWVDPETRDLVIQGWKADEETTEECLKAGPTPDSEGVVRVPARLAEAIKEAIRVAEGPDVR